MFPSKTHYKLRECFELLEEWADQVAREVQPEGAVLLS